jgi:hypothetical protein
MPSTPLELNPTVAEVCTDVVNECSIYLRPQELVQLSEHNTVDHLIEKKLGSQIVQSCSKDGFVLSESKSIRNESRSNRALYKPLRIITRSPGEVPAEHLNGAFVYRVCYSHFVCNPPIHAVVPAVVCEKNKLGIRCHYYPYTFNTDDNTVEATDVARAGAQFLAIFLPRVLHSNLQMASDPDGDAGMHDADSNSLKTSSLSPAELYEQEEERIDTNEKELEAAMSAAPVHEGGENEGGGGAPTTRKRTIIHVKILQKRFDINDKQISAVGVLDIGGYSG